MRVEYKGGSLFGVVAIDDCFMDNVVVYNLREAQPEQFYGCVLDDFQAMPKKMTKSQFEDYDKIVLHIGTDRYYSPGIVQKIKDSLAWFIYKNLEKITNQDFEKGAK